jgi:hypothetical protein
MLVEDRKALLDGFIQLANETNTWILTNGYDRFTSDAHQILITDETSHAGWTRGYQSSSAQRSKSQV